MKNAMLRIALLTTTTTLVLTGVATAQSVRLVNRAGLSPSQVAMFTNAARRIINGNMYRQWRTPSLQWTSRSRGSWTIEFHDHLGPVKSICGENAVGCHGVRNGEPFAIVDTNRDSGRIWSVAGTHEMEEMFVDPFLRRKIVMPHGSGDRWLAEVSDPVQDFHHNVAGLQVSDYVYPSWYLSTDQRQDDMNVLNYGGSNGWYFSCPTGFAAYYSWDGMHPTRARCGGAQRTRSTHAVAPAISRSVNQPPNRMQPVTRTALRSTALGGKVAIFPIAK